jgi:DNA primase
MDDIERIKQKLDITDYIETVVSLKRAGRNFKGLCPFHSEKSPSFMVSPERQIWHCFGCQKGGDIFSFVMEYEKLDFAEALKELAQTAGIKLERMVFRTDTEQKKDSVYTLNALAAQYYHFLLTKHPVGKQALAYVKEKRAIPDGLIEKFQLGFAPQKNSALIEYLVGKKKMKREDIVTAGLATPARGSTVDFFVHRLIFPIQDARGNIIAFSGRALDDETLPKYINTRETLVYKKSNSLFGIFHAKDAIRKEKKGLLMEGEFDVISCFKEGIGNAVAVKGTALTEEQIRLLKRYTEKILFCFDTDIAGSAAQKRSIAMMEKEGLSSSVIIPPEGKDPDELLRENPALFKKALKNEINVYEFIIQSALKMADYRTSEGKKKILEETLPILSAVDNEVIKEHYLKKLAESIDSSLDSVLRQSNKNKQRPIIQIQKPKAQTKGREELTEQYLLSLILQSKKPAKFIAHTQTQLQEIELTTPALQKLWKDICTVYDDTGSFSPESFAKQIPSELVEVFDTCSLTPLPEFEKDEDYDKEVQKAAYDTAALAIRLKIKHITDMLQTNNSQTEAEFTELNTNFTKYTGLLSALKIHPLE